MSETLKTYRVNDEISLVPDGGTVDFLNVYGITEAAAQDRVLRGFANALAEAERARARRRALQHRYDAEAGVEPEC